MNVIITATSQDGSTDQGEPTDIDTAREWVELLSGRFGIVYRIENI